MKEQLLQAWDIHQSKNLLLLQNIPEEALAATLSPKGRTVGQQLAHLHNVRIHWTEHVAKTLYQKDLLIPKEAVPSRPALSAALAQSALVIASVIGQSWEAGGRLPSFKTGLLPFVSYLISHESHHRGQMLLTLKQNGIKLPDALKWGLWEWAKPLPSAGA